MYGYGNNSSYYTQFAVFYALRNTNTHSLSVLKLKRVIFDGSLIIVMDTNITLQCLTIIIFVRNKKIVFCNIIQYAVHTKTFMKQ